MKILVVCMLHTYGDAKREYSFEYFNFYQVLNAMGHEVELFDFMEETRLHGKSEMNRRLLDRVRSTQPAAALFSLYTDQFEEETINSLRLFTKTFCFFHDDTWRVDYSQHWAKKFDYFSTPDLHGEIKYREIGIPNGIYFPFGCNERLFRKLETTKKYDVSFVGGWHPYREWLIKRIKDAGISVEVRGHRWPKGEVSQEEMVNIFNQSKINLNLTNSASWDIRYLASSPRAIINRIRSKKNIEQMKARIFEVNGCGGFQLSYFVEGLANCYEIDREIVVYSGVDDLIEKIRFYLKHESLREAVANEGYLRTIRDHTYAKRFQNVLDEMRVING
jgi:spore maturation protein CgeB